MPTCPRCHEKQGISRLAKVWSDSAAPALCQSCGNYAYVPPMGYMLKLVAHLIGAGAIIASLALWQWWPTGLAIAGFAAWVAWRSTLAPMLSLTPAEAAAAKRAGNVLLVAVVAVALAAYLLYRYGA